MERCTLVAGWFSFDEAEVTAGDLLAQQTVSRWLDEAALPHLVAVAPPFRRFGQVGWDDPDPAAIEAVVWVCGPIAGDPPTALYGRYPGARRIAAGVSAIPGAGPALDVLIERDSPAATRADLSLGTASTPVPVVATIRAHAQPEYGDRQRHGEADRLIDRVVARTGAVPLDTRLHATQADLLSTPEQLSSTVARFDALVTSRMHGLVLGLQAGTPVLAVDPIAGGAKVLAQARTLGWPAVAVAGATDDARLADLLDWCLGAEARDAAAAVVDRAAPSLEESCRLLLAAVGER
jgi:hypothetical protein